MMRDTFSDDLINVLLRQLGAESIKTSPAYINTAKFPIGNGLHIKYRYEMKEEEIYLNRVSPYPMIIGRLYNEQQVVDLIAADIKKFKSAYASSNFSKFIDVTNNVMNFDRELENLFMTHNVAGADLDKINGELEKIHELIAEIGVKSPLLY